jgi:cytochrome c-type biogenesis protein CcmE
MKKNTMVIIGGFIIAGAIVFLLMAATPGSSGVELTLKQLIATQDQHKHDYVTVQGNIIEKSIKWNPEKIELQFNIKDNQGDLLHVLYNGPKPDNFSEGVIAILQGSPTTKDHFKAETVKTRCPSKYEGKNVKDMPKNYDPKTHKEKTNVPPKGN